MLNPKQPDLPWTKREIIDAVINTYVPARVDEQETWAFSTMMTAFMGLALGRPKGRLAPYIEQALWTRIRRVFTALREGRDPNAAYDVPLEDEAPRGAEEMLEATLSRSWREMDKMLDEADRKIRAARSPQ